MKPSNNKTNKKYYVLLLIIALSASPLIAAKGRDAIRKRIAAKKNKVNLKDNSRIEQSKADQTALDNYNGVPTRFVGKVWRRILPNQIVAKSKVPRFYLPANSNDSRQRGATMVRFKDTGNQQWAILRDPTYISGLIIIELPKGHGLLNLVDGEPIYIEGIVRDGAASHTEKQIRRSYPRYVLMSAFKNELTYEQICEIVNISIVLKSENEILKKEIERLKLSIERLKRLSKNEEGAASDS